MMTANLPNRLGLAKPLLINESQYEQQSQKCI